MKKLVSVKQLLYLLLLVSFFMAFVFPAAAADDEIGLVYNGQNLVSDTVPVIIDDHTMVPLKVIADTVGAGTAWDPDTKMVTVEGSDQDGNVLEIRLTAGSNQAQVTKNHSTSNEELDVPATIINDRIMVPLRFIGENLGLEVNWDKDKRLVYLADREHSPEFGDNQQVQVTAKKVEYSNDKIEVNLKIPVLSGMDNKEIEESINKTLESDALSYRDTVEKWADEGYIEAIQFGYEFRKHYVSVDYSVKYNENGILSIPALFSAYTGGAHGNYQQIPYNFDLSTGNNLSLAELLQDKPDFETEINEEVSKQIKSNPDMYYNDEIGGFQGISDEQSYYICQGNLVVYFDPYEIAPYAAGIREFKIPFARAGLSLPLAVKSNTGSITVSGKEIQYANDIIEVDITYPVISGMQDQIVQDKINAELENDALDFKDEIEKSAEVFHATSANKGLEFWTYSACIDYGVHFNNGDLLSIASDFYEYTGGAHGMTVREPYNYDLKNGEELQLEDLFTKDFDYAAVINQKIEQQIRDNPDMYFEDALLEFAGIGDDQAFYITDDSLVVYFGLYELAPYCAGIQEFEIPLQSLKDGLVYTI